MERHGDRGALRVYLGAAPGVGKTYAMLDEGRRRLERGTDVVVAYVEHHGRARTEALLDGLEVLPRRQVAHRGAVLEELDLDAVLARRPTVALVDELAHTNAPGSRHAKRWQDVEAMLAAGIDVVTTVNIQHLESLNDVTAQITGVRQRETVPDPVVRGADQIELVDMSPQALRRRMAHGNVYPADRIDAALSRYFREGNLTALRELALLWLADRVDERLDDYREQHEIDSTWPARERIVVPVSGGPESVTLMRRAARIAARRSGGEWRALLVTRGDGLSNGGGGLSPEGLTALRAKAEELGGALQTVVGDDPARTILEVARAENATQVVIGASRRGRVSTLLRPGVGERVVLASGDIDVHIVTHDYARQGTPALQPRERLGRRRRAVGFAFAVLGPALLSLGLALTPDLHGLPTEAMLLMAVVVATALLGGLLPAVVASVLSGLLLNVLFTPPLYTLTVADPENALAIGLFMVVGLAVASVVDTAARRTAQAIKARAEADALTVLAHGLLRAGDDLDGLLASAAELFGATGAALVRREDDGSERVLASHGRMVPSVEDADMSADVDDRTVLVLAGSHLATSERRLLTAYAAWAKVMAERRRAASADLERHRLAEADRTRTALLAAVSHDLRSPLSGVKAAVASLRSDEVDWSPEDEAALLETIEEATDRLTALVANLLDMSRIHTGVVRPAAVELGLGRAVRAAVAGLDGGSRIAVAVPDDVRVVADPGLLERVVANLAENALKYVPLDATVRVDAAAPAGDAAAGDGTGVGAGVVTLRVVDTGPGVARGAHDRLFAPFQRLGDVPGRDGVGLGLAVARGFVEAMGGTLVAEDTPGGGLTLVVELPAAADPARGPAPDPASEQEPAARPRSVYVEEDA